MLYISLQHSYHVFSIAVTLQTHGCTESLPIAIIKLMRYSIKNYEITRNLHKKRGSLFHMEENFYQTQVLSRVYAEVEQRYAHVTDLAHGWEHISRVYTLSQYMAEKEGADLLIVGLAALLHDLGHTVVHIPSDTTPGHSGHSGHSTAPRRGEICRVPNPGRKEGRSSARPWPLRSVSLHFAERPFDSMDRFKGLFETCGRKFALDGWTDS